MLSREKPLVKPMVPGSLSYYIASLLLSLSDLTFASGREGIDNPFIALVARFLIVCAGTR